MHRTPWIVLSILLVLGSVGGSLGAQERQAAPAFALRDTDGALHRLSDYRGRWVALEWVDFTCAAVTAHYEAPRRAMQALQRAAMARGVVWLSVNSTPAGRPGSLTASQGKAALARHAAAPTALLLDTTGRVGRSLRVQVAPEARVVSPQGAVVYAGAVEHLHEVLEAATRGRPVPFASKPARGCPVPYAADTAARGPRAPDFALRDSTGVVRRLRDLRGTWVVLEWVNYDCPFVRKQYHVSHRAMQALQARSARQGVVWLSICSSAPGSEGHLTSAQANARMKALGASPTAYLHDPQGTVGRAYGARKTPEIRVVSPQGTIEYAGGIDSIASMSVRDIPRAQNYVALALADIAAGRPIATTRSRAYGCSVKY